MRTEKHAAETSNLSKRLREDDRKEIARQGGVQDHPRDAPAQCAKVRNIVTVNIKILLVVNKSNLKYMVA